MQLSDREIYALSTGDKPMISPCYRPTSGDGIISYGVTSYGYDARLGNEFMQQSHDGGYINPKRTVADDFHRFTEDSPFAIPPHSFLLAKTAEYYRIPRDIMVLCFNKSTYARCGLLVTPTVFEPEWHGVVTLELANLTNSWITIFPNEGICQFIFLRAGVACDISYADKGGKYQGQTGVTLPKVIW